MRLLHVRECVFICALKSTIEERRARESVRETVKFAKVKQKCGLQILAEEKRERLNMKGTETERRKKRNGERERARMREKLFMCS